MTTTSNLFQKLSPTTLADVLTRANVMDSGLRPLWQGMPRIAGPAFTVRCPAGDNLMLHAAIYRAPAGSVIVVESADDDYAVAGGNVCAVAQKRGIAGFVIDGVIRDLAEVRESKFPVFARGVIPIPGGKNQIDTLNGPIRCGGVQVSPGDMVIADEEGIVVVPSSRIDEIGTKAQVRAEKDAAETLEIWEKNHRAKIEELLRSKGFTLSSCNRL
jgi:4-hydroxy-4-methyl-2-oxoglutarate aldolase